jgi:hypothetical protein
VFVKAVSALESLMLGYALLRHVRGVLGEESLPDAAECLELLGGELAEESVLRSL